MLILNLQDGGCFEAASYPLLEQQIESYQKQIKISQPKEKQANKQNKHKNAG